MCIRDRPLTVFALSRVLEETLITANNGTAGARHVATCNDGIRNYSFPYVTADALNGRRG